MRTPLMTCTRIDRDTGYAYLFGGSPVVGDTPEQFAQLLRSLQSVSCSNFRVLVNDPPGLGNGYRFTVFVAAQWWYPPSTGISQKVSLTISDLETEGQAGVAFSISDVAGVIVEKIGTPPDTYATFAMALDSDDDYSIVPGTANFGSSGAAGTAGLLGPTTASTDLSGFPTRKLIPIDGTLKTFIQTTQGVTPHIFTTRTIQIYKNGVQQASRTSDGADVGIELATMPIFRGDWVNINFQALYSADINHVRTTTEFIRLTAGNRFYPTVANSGFLSGNTGFIGSNKFAAPNADSDVRDDENTVRVVSPAGFKLSNLIVLLQKKPGGGKSIDVTLRKNGVSTALSVSLSGFQISDVDQVNEVLVAPGDLLSMQVEFINSAPSQSWIAWGLRYDINVQTQTVASRMNGQAVLQQAITSRMIAHPPPTTGYAQVITSRMYVKGTQTVESRMQGAPITQRQIQSRMRGRRRLNDGTGWSGPWATGDNQPDAPIAYVNPNSDPNRFSWFTGDTGITLDGAGPGVIGWADRSGSGRDASVSSGNGPTLTLADTPSGQDALSWPATTTRRLAQGGSLGLAQPWTLILAVKIVGWVSNNYLIDGTSTGASSALIQHTTTPRVALYAGGAFVDNNDLALDGNYHLITAIFNGASSSIQIDNLSAVTGNPGSTAPGSLYLGNYSGGTAHSAECLMAGLIVTQSVDPTMIANHKNWLANYVGLTI